MRSSALAVGWLALAGAVCTCSACQPAAAETAQARYHLKARFASLSAETLKAFEIGDKSYAVLDDLAGFFLYDATQINKTTNVRAESKETHASGQTLTIREAGVAACSLQAVIVGPAALDVSLHSLDGPVFAAPDPVRVRSGETLVVRGRSGAGDSLLFLLLTPRVIDPLR